MDHVLVVEDDHAICDIMCDALREGGLSVECVGDDQAAYRRIADLPTLAGLVLDVNLGAGTTGYDVARFARQVIDDIAVIYVSGEVRASSLEAFGVPESTFVQKPFTPVELVEAVTAKLSAKCELS